MTDAEVGVTGTGELEMLEWEVSLPSSRVPPLTVQSDSRGYDGTAKYKLKELIDRKCYRIR